MSAVTVPAGFVLVPEEFLDFLRSAPVSSGTCCCGDDMEKHSDPMSCGHSPVDMWDHSLDQWLKEIAARPAITAGTDAGAVASILRAALQEFGLDENTLSESEKLGRHSAVRGMMVRLGLYPVFCELLAKDATDDEIAAALTPPETAEAVPVAVDRLRDLEGAQAVLDGHHAEFGETPSMTGSRARIAERELADAVKALETARSHLTAILSIETHPLHVGYDDGSGGGNFVYAEVIRTDDPAFAAARSASSQGCE